MLMRGQNKVIKHLTEVAKYWIFVDLMLLRERHTPSLNTTGLNFDINLHGWMFYLFFQPQCCFFWDGPIMMMYVFLRLKKCDLDLAFLLRTK